jgi:hypothetical protein
MKLIQFKYLMRALFIIGELLILKIKPGEKLLKEWTNLNKDYHNYIQFTKDE